jgi:hypothetical protein
MKEKTARAVSKPDNTERFCKHMHWAYLAKAVHFVYRENSTGRMGLSPTTDDWCIKTAPRKDIMERVVRHWERMTRESAFNFPFSEDAVFSLYMRLRKRSAEEVAAYEAEVDAALTDLM